VIGVSREATPETLRKALTEASEAAAYGARVARGSGVYHFEDLGLRQLLGRLSDGPELSQFVEAEVGPLLGHDAGRRTPLLQTLRVYLESGGRKAEAARALHLERRSLYYRLDKIEKLLGRRLDDPAARLRLEVALQGLDVLRQRSNRA
jgi:purine catabolism regulator